jgi:hypothetical protein
LEVLSLRSLLLLVSLWLVPTGSAAQSLAQTCGPGRDAEFLSRLYSGDPEYEFVGHNATLCAFFTPARVDSVADDIVSFEVFLVWKQPRRTRDAFEQSYLEKYVHMLLEGDCRRSEIRVTGEIRSDIEGNPRGLNPGAGQFEFQPRQGALGIALSKACQVQRGR